jgi:hypothetical protein
MRSRITRIIKLTNCQARPTQKSIVKLNSSVNELNQKVTLINDIMVYQFLLFNTVYVPLFAFYKVYN